MESDLKGLRQMLGKLRESDVSSPGQPIESPAQKLMEASEWEFVSPLPSNAINYDSGSLPGVDMVRLKDVVVKWNLSDMDVRNWGIKDFNPVITGISAIQVIIKDNGEEEERTVTFDQEQYKIKTETQPGWGFTVSEINIDDTKKKEIAVTFVAGVGYQS